MNHSKTKHKSKAKGHRSAKRSGGSRAGDVANGSSSIFSSMTRYVARKKPFRVHIPPHLQLFPDEFECFGKTQLTAVFNGALAISYTFKANGVFNLFGPQVNWTGAYSANVPSGSIFLLHNPSAAGSVAPYNTSTVLGQDITVEVSSYGSTATAGAQIALLASPNTNSLSGMTFSAIREQDGCSSMLVPAVLNAPITVRQRFSIADVAGVKPFEVYNDPSFGQVAGTDPNTLVYFVLYMASVDGSTNLNHELAITFNTHLLFRRKNNFITTVPTISGAPVSPSEEYVHCSSSRPTPCCLGPAPIQLRR